MLKYTWHKQIEETSFGLYNIMYKMRGHEPTKITLDTETTGLHIKHDKPFVITFGYVVDDGAFAYAIDIEHIDPKHVYNLLGLIYRLTETGWLIGHNILFDMAILQNYGAPVGRYDHILDTMSLIRLGTDAVQVDKGGAPLGLKDFCSRYIDKAAKFRESIVAKEREEIAEQYNKQLKEMLPRGTRGMVIDILNKVPNDVDDLPPELGVIYTQWYNALPVQIKQVMKKHTVTKADIPYSMVNRQALMDYACYDAIYTYEVYEMLMPIVKIRQPESLFEQEMRLIPHLVDMITTGFRINKPYMLDVKPKLKAHINERLKQFNELTKRNISPNQNKALLDLLRETNPDLESVNKESLEILSDSLDEDDEDDQETDEIIRMITELRRLVKWYSTYFLKFYKTMQFDDYIYASLNAAGTVTGRFTSDFQQFPKKAIKNKDGEVLLHPRDMIIAPEGYYLVMIDYSQIELRLQALYTILLGYPDVNMCRVYMPYKCYHYITHEPFDYTKHEHVSRWDEKQPDGLSAWLFEENGKPWVETDQHAATTDNCFPGHTMDKKSKEYETLRSTVGKRLNFACNYGAKPKKIQLMYHGITLEEATRRYEAYRNTFPGVIKYQRSCYDEIAMYGYGTNLYGRRYYGSNGHNLGNAKVQGSGADLLKEKIIQLNEHRLHHKTESRLLMTIHDENLWIVKKGEAKYIWDYKRIMEDVGDTYIPIIAEVEVSETTWAQKTKGFTINDDGTITIHA